MMENLDRLKAALAKVAKLVVVDPVYVPIFTRLEAEVAKAEANDVMARARALAQSATF
jgi:hypothetical protein